MAARRVPLRGEVGAAADAGGGDGAPPARVTPDEDAAAVGYRGGSMTGRRGRRCRTPRNAMLGARVKTVKAVKVGGSPKKRMNENNERGIERLVRYRVRLDRRCTVL